MNKKRVVVAGSNGMVGSAIYLQLKSDDRFLPVRLDRSIVDLTNKPLVDAFLKAVAPDIVINCAARVGGIYANKTYPADFMRDNLAINTNLIDSAYNNHVKRFINLGSSCIYPRDCSQPIKEEYLLTGPLEKTNDAYALAKIAGLEMCRHYRNQYGVYYHSVMPTNLYGSNDNYHPENSHVLPALIRKFHEAKLNGLKEHKMWGTGKAKREFLHADDLASAVVFLIDKQDLPDIINIGTGKDIPIKELADKIKHVVGFEGELSYDTNALDGTMVKLLDVSVMKALGWESSISLDEGVKKAYADFLIKLDNKTLRGLA